MNKVALGEVEVQTAKEWIDRGDAVLVDVREPAENARERIPGSKLLPMSGFDPAAFAAFGGKCVIIHCASGKRSRIAGERLLEVGIPNVFVLQGDFPAWREAGYPTETG